MTSILNRYGRPGSLADGSSFAQYWPEKCLGTQIGTIMLVWVHYEKNGGPEKEFLGDFDTFSAALINLNENAALKRFGRRFKTTPNNKFVEIGPFLKNEDGEECLLMDE